MAFGEYPVNHEGGATSPVTVDNETSTIPGARQLVSGTNTTVDTSTPGQIKVNASGGGSSPFIPAGFVPISAFSNWGSQSIATDGIYAYVAGTLASNGHAAIAQIKIADGTTKATWDSGISSRADNLVLSQDGSTLYSILTTNTDWFKISTSGMTTAHHSTLSAGLANQGQPYDLSPDNSKFIYVDGLTDNVYEINTSSYTVTTVPVGHSDGGGTAGACGVCFYNGSSTNFKVAYNGLAAVDEYDSGSYTSSVATGAAGTPQFTILRSGVNNTFFIGDAGTHKAIVGVRSGTPSIQLTGTAVFSIAVNIGSPTSTGDGEDIAYYLSDSLDSSSTTQLYEFFYDIGAFRNFPILTPSSIWANGTSGVAVAPDSSERLFTVSGATYPEVWTVLPLQHSPSPGPQGNVQTSDGKGSWISAAPAGGSSFTILPIASGGTGVGVAGANALASGYAADGTNNDITSLTALTGSQAGMFSGGVQTLSTTPATISATGGSLVNLTHSGTPITVTLPDATTCSGKIFFIYTYNGTAIYVKTVSSQTINGVNVSGGAGSPLASGPSTGEVNGMLISDGSNWHTLGAPLTPAFGATANIVAVNIGNTWGQTPAGNVGQALLAANGNTPAWSSTYYANTSVSSNTTLGAGSDKFINASAASGNITITLTPTANKEWSITRTDTSGHTLNIVAGSGSLIGDSGSLFQYGDTKNYWSDGTNIYSQGTSETGGGLFGGVTSVSSSPFTLSASSGSIVLFNSGAVQAILPDATTCTGKIFALINVGANGLDLQTSNSQTIGGQAAWTSSGQIFFTGNSTGTTIIISDGSNWQFLLPIMTNPGNFVTAGAGYLIGTAGSRGMLTNTVGGSTVANQPLLNLGSSNGFTYGNIVYSNTSVSTSQTLGSTTSKYIIATGTITLTLTPTANKEWIIFNNDGNVKTIAAGSGSLLGTNGASMTSQNSSRTYFSDGTNIYCVGANGI